jgi:hypothetical protein
MTRPIREDDSDDGAARPFPGGARTWLAIVLAWQLVGLAGSLALALPWGDFHPFVKWLIVGLTFTNLLGLLTCAVAYAYRKWLYRLPLPLRVTTVVLGLAFSAAVSVPVTFAVGRRVCEADAWVADRYHLLMVGLDAVLLAAIALTCALVLVHQRLSSDLARRVRDNARLERLQVETQLSLLQSKVNPHFLFNTLSTMLELVRSEPAKVERRSTGRCSPGPSRRASAWRTRRRSSSSTSRSRRSGWGRGSSSRSTWRRTSGAWRCRR